MIEFKHGEENITDAIVGSSIEEVKEILTEIAQSPEDFIGTTCSETAEFIYENASDPNMLLIITKAFLNGLSGGSEA